MGTTVQTECAPLHISRGSYGSDEGNEKGGDKVGDDWCARGYLWCCKEGGQRNSRSFGSGGGCAVEEGREVCHPRGYDDQAQAQASDQGRDQERLWEADQGEGETSGDCGESLCGEGPQGQ